MLLSLQCHQCVCVCGGCSFIGLVLCSSAVPEALYHALFLIQPSYVSEDTRDCAPTTFIYTIAYTTTYLHITGIHYYVLAHYWNTLLCTCTLLEYTTTYLHITGIHYYVLAHYWNTLLLAHYCPTSSSIVSFQAISYEYAVEMTYPLPEGTSANIVNVVSQVSTILSCYSTVYELYIGHV